MTEAILRQLTPHDIADAMNLSSEAGWNQTGDDWRMLIGLEPEGCFALEVDGRVAATTTLLCYGQKLAWVGMVLTAKHYRARGFARRLLKEALAEADRRGIETVKLDATEQGRPLYEKHGFRFEQAIERWTRPGTSGELLTISKIELAEDALRQDALAFGAERSELLRELERCHSGWSQGRSYLYARPGRQTAYLGPCVCDDDQTAAALLEQALETAGAPAWSWDLLPSNRQAVGNASTHGFAPQRYLSRMVRGKELRGKEDAIHAIAGFELG